jgi:hypothetical protein
MAIQTLVAMCAPTAAIHLLLSLGFFAAATIASVLLRLPDTMVMPKPNFNGDFNLVEKIQISIAFRDAQQMAVAAYEAVIVLTLCHLLLIDIVRLQATTKSTSTTSPQAYPGCSTTQQKSCKTSSS